MRAPLRPPNPGLTQHSSPHDFSLGARPQAVQLEPASRWTPINQIAITSIVAAGPFHMPHGRANVQYKAKCAVKPRVDFHTVSRVKRRDKWHMVVVFIKIYALRARSIVSTVPREREGASRCQSRCRTTHDVCTGLSQYTRLTEALIKRVQYGSSLYTVRGVRARVQERT